VSIKGISLSCHIDPIPPDNHDGKDYSLRGLPYSAPFDDTDPPNYCRPFAPESGGLRISESACAGGVGQIRFFSCPLCTERRLLVFGPHGDDARISLHFTGLVFTNPRPPRNRVCVVQCARTTGRSGGRPTRPAAGSTHVAGVIKEHARIPYGRIPLAGG